MSTSKEKHIVIYLYYSMRDPLCEGLMLSYLKALNMKDTAFHLVTYEQEKYQLSKKETKALQSELKNNFRIYWHPIPYLSGRFFMLKKIISAVRAVFLVRKIKRQFDLHLICAMATPVGTYAFIASRLFRITMCQFTFEPHALIMMQSGRMNAHSFKYKLAHGFEMKIGRSAEYVVCTTRHMVNDLKSLNAKGEIIRLPTSVDETSNVFDAEMRSQIRNRFGIQNKTVLIYPGKFGGMYRTISTIELIAAYLQKMENGHVIIITDHDLSEIKSWVEECQIPNEQITLLSSVSLAELPAYISAADVGLIAYENFESRKYCSPVKTGEYLLCGLPYIVQRGTSEDDEVAERENVGIVLETFDKTGLDKKWNSLVSLLNENKNELRKRCRDVGEKYRGKKNALQTMRELFDRV